MGGERETVAEQKVQDAAGADVVVGSVRYHENKSQIHFHDDANKLKVAIPVATWYKAWISLQSSVPGEWHYADPDNKTILHVIVKCKKANQKKGRETTTLDVLLHIEKIAVSDDYAKLCKFSSK